MAKQFETNGMNWTKENTPEKMQEQIRKGKVANLSESDGSELSEVRRKINNAPKGKI